MVALMAVFRPSIRWRISSRPSIRTHTLTTRPTGEPASCSVLPPRPNLLKEM